MKPKTFETERLILRPTSEEDAAFIYELMNTPKWIKYIGDRNIRSAEDAKAYIRKKMIPQLEKLGFSNYTLIRKQDGKKIGSCGLYDREGLEGIDIGYALLPEFEKKGFGFEASKKLIEIAFLEFGIDRISAITNQDNLESQKLVEKLGLTRNGTVILPDEDQELLVYFIDK